MKFKGQVLGSCQELVEALTATSLQSNIQDGAITLVTKELDIMTNTLLGAPSFFDFRSPTLQLGRNRAQALAWLATLSRSR
jgi:hypothetical protein